MIQYHKMSLLDVQCDYICHQVNCQGKMNSGVAKAIREKWPVVYENYVAKYNEVIRIASSALTLPESLLLGDIQIVGLWDDYFKAEKHQSVINMFAQANYGYDGRKYTSYDAFWSCLGKIKDCCPKGSTIAFPYKIGCCRGGADWEVISKMIERVLGEDYTIYICWREEDVKND